MIEKYKDEYLDEVLKIWLDASIIAHNFIPESYWRSKLEDMRNIYIPASDTYVYLNDRSEVHGFISLVDNFIAAIFVSPTLQGQGIGKLLMLQAKKLHSTVELSVYAENKSSVEFYKIQEFVIEEEKIEEHTGHLEYRMRYKNE